MKIKTILITGCPGFIGINFVTQLLKNMNGRLIVSMDNVKDDYDPVLKGYWLGLV